MECAREAPLSLYTPVTRTDPTPAILPANNPEARRAKIHQPSATPWEESQNQQLVDNTAQSLPPFLKGRGAGGDRSAKASDACQFLTMHGEISVGNAKCTCI